MYIHNGILVNIYTLMFLPNAPINIHLRGWSVVLIKEPNG